MKRHLFACLLVGQYTFAQVKQNKDFFLKNDSINLYAFIGQKISLVQYDSNKDYKSNGKMVIDSITGDTMIMKSYVLDNAFDARYKVIQCVYNNLETDTIEFKVYDHYGRPAFENYSIVLLYISKSEDGSYYFHQKYQFDPLFKTNKRSWKGKNGESIKDLFNLKKESVFKARGIFK